MAGTLNLFACVGDVMGVMGRGRRDKRNGLTGMRDHLHMSTSAIALEPRFMFDAAGVATAADAVTPDPTADAHLDNTDHSVDQKLLAAAAQATESVGTGTSTEPAKVAAPIEPHVTEATSARVEITFIDTSVTDWETLRDNLRPKPR